MKYLKASLLVACLGAATTASAQDMSAEDLAKAVKARQAVMQLYAFNLGTLGNMAKGTIDYDMDAAQAAAGNLVKLASQNQMAYWPQGSAAGEVEGSKALPAIWENMGEVMEHSTSLIEAATAAEAATDLAGLQAAMGGIGGSCGGCHKSFRQSN